MKEVAELARVISKQIHDTPWKRNTLLQDTPAWEMLWSCFDAVEDRALALEAYLEMPEPPDQGTRYLVVCGALQALFVQQDAIVNLADALDVTYEPNFLLKEVREIRNNSIGHPTKRGGEGKAFNFFPRHIDTKQDFDLMTTYPDGTPPTFQYVNIPKLIEDQRSVVKEFLQNVDAHLEREDMEHKEQFRKHRLQDAFPQTLRYNISKIYEAIRGNPGRETYLKLDFGAVEKTLAAFRERLAERGEAGAYLGVEDILDCLDYPLQRLRAYLERRPEERMNEKDAYIYFSFMQDRFDKLREMAKEIDESYEGSTNVKS